MKKINKYLLLTGACATMMLSACDFEEINTNPFEITDQEGIMDGIAVGGLITVLEQNVIPVGTQADDTHIINEYQVGYHLSADCWSGFFGQNNSWDGGNSNPSYFLKDGWIAVTYNWGYTKSLKPWKKLKETCETNNTPEVYALAQILKISSWHKALESFGPIPYSHAADNSMKIFSDSEKEIYEQMFADLTSSIETLTSLAENGVTVMEQYDAVYAGDCNKWVKYANSLMLRLAMRVRFVDNALAQKYASAAVNHSIGVMTAIDDEAKMGMGAGMVFINNIEWLSNQYGESRMGSSMFSYLLGYKDPRLSVYFTPAKADLVDAGLAIEAFDGKSYQAVPNGHAFGQQDMFKSCSRPNFNPTTPTYWLRASEVYFLRAEAALVWGNSFGSAEDLYEQGVAMSFNENGIAASVEDYLDSGNKPMAHEFLGAAPSAPCQTTAKFEGSTEEKLEKIMVQKWIALFPNGQEAWTEWRRTGYPHLNPVMENRGASMGVTKERGVRRMQYPSSFYKTEEGREVYNDALQKLGGVDSPATPLWWDRKN